MANAKADKTKPGNVQGLEEKHAEIPSKVLLPGFDGKLAGGKPEFLTARVSGVIFYNAENSYSVLEIESDQDVLVASGVMPQLSVGETAEFYGEFVEHPLYGLQYKVASVRKKRPVTSNEIRLFLASGRLKGLGEKTAARLVEKFGTETLEILKHHPDKTAELRGISLAKAKSFQDALLQIMTEDDLTLLLLPYGINASQIRKISRVLGPMAETVIRQNPYWLSQHVTGIGFATAEKIAKAFGIEGDSEIRVGGILMYYLNKLMMQGGPTVFKRSLTAQALKEKYSISTAAFHNVMEIFLQDGTLCMLPDAEDSFTFTHIYKLSQAAANRLLVLQNSENIKASAKWPHAANAEAALAAHTKNSSFALGNAQKQAVIAALTRNVSVITGGAGTGKTTTVKIIAAILQQAGLKVLLLAPTGKAARRISEVTGVKAFTVHKALMIRSDDMYDSTGIYDELTEDPEASSAQNVSGSDVEDTGKQRLDADYIIIDECSMIDIFLFARLLAGVAPGTRLIFLGDKSQLLSIGPGKVFDDLISSGTFAVTVLNTVYRQEAHCLLAENANRIIRGQKLVLDQTLASDFLLITESDNTRFAALTAELVTKILPQHYGIDGIYNTQIITPLHKGAAGVEALNEIMQLRVQGENFAYVASGRQKFAVGDKVMQTKNDYQAEYVKAGTKFFDKGIMNGESGVVTAIDSTLQTISVMFDEQRLASISGERLKNIELSYATTIHKTQGSEYDNVILLLPSYLPRDFISRNLLYTAVTRAKKHLFIITAKKTLNLMAGAKIAHERQTMLADFLRIAQNDGKAAFRLPQ